MKPDTFRRTSSGSSPQTRAEVGKPILRIDPIQLRPKTTTSRRIPGISQSPVIFTTETNRSIAAVTPIVSQAKTDVFRPNHGIKPDQSTGAFRNISGVRRDQVRPDPPNISDTIAKTSTVTQTVGDGKPAPGKHNISNQPLLGCSAADEPISSSIVLECNAT